MALGEMSRREAARLLAQGAAGLMLARTALAAEKTNQGPPQQMLQRPIPSSGEKTPVIGLGSWQVFDIGPDAAPRQALEEVLSRFVALARTFFLIPMVLPPIVVGVIWKLIYTPDISPIYYVAGLLHVTMPSLTSSVNFALTAIIIADT